MQLTTDEKRDLVDAFERLNPERARDLLAWVKAGANRLHGIELRGRQVSPDSLQIDDVFLNATAAKAYVARTRHPAVYRTYAIDLLGPNSVQPRRIAADAVPFASATLAAGGKRG